MEHLAELIWLILVFMLGASVGSFINVVVGRLPLEKSVLWPNSHCLTCLRRLRFQDNLPILGWLVRRGRCRFCNTSFSSRYLWVELFTGLAFAALFYWEVLANLQRQPFFDSNNLLRVQGVPSWQAMVCFLHHALLVSFLIAASLCDLDSRAIPLSLTTTGTLLGILSATLWPWPWPQAKAVIPGVPTGQNWAFGVPQGIPHGLYPWPVWGPLPNFLIDNAWLLGLLTGLAGAFMGMFLIRAVKFLFERGLGKEALGLGDADLMMLGGAFLGWQVIIVAFFVGAVVSLPFGVLLALRKGERALPFGPGLALGMLLTWMAWPKLAPLVQPSFFDEFLIVVMVTVMGGGIFVASILLRLFGFGAPASANTKPT
jgi:leader peptidase (prepilin peptidase)/N-methyltransferase